MTTLIVQPDNPDVLTMSKEEALEALASSTLNCLRELKRLAALVGHLENDLGVDLRQYKLAWIGTLRKIYRGELLPELAFELMGSRAVMRAVAECPIAQQKQLAEAKYVTVERMDTDKQWDRTHRPITDLSPSEIAQVFSPNGIRNEEEQRAWLLARAERFAKPSAPPIQFRFNRTKKVVVISSPCEVNLRTLREWVKTLSA